MYQIFISPASSYTVERITNIKLLKDEGLIFLCIGIYYLFSNKRRYKVKGGNNICRKFAFVVNSFYEKRVKLYFQIHAECNTYITVLLHA